LFYWAAFTNDLAVRASKEDVQTKAFLIVSLVFLLALAIVITVSHFMRTNDRVRLTVRVIHLLDQSVVAGATVEIVSNNGHTVGHQSLGGEGTATFEVPPGTYIVRMASGYTGQAEIALHSEKVVTLKVIPVLR
jgi:hypothetical protein